MPDAGIVSRKPSDAGRAGTYKWKQKCGTSAVIACLDGATLDEIRNGTYLQEGRWHDASAKEYSKLDDPKKALKALKDIAPRTMNQEQTIGRAREMIKQGTVTLDELRELQELIRYWNDYSKYWD